MKSMKKLVLVGFVLLASVVVLAGCKNDSVPEVTPAKLVSITVTPPSRTVYSVGESFDSTGMEVIATYDDESSREVTGWTTDFGVVTSEKGLDKEVTVSYSEGEIIKEATFTIDVASYQFTETVKEADSAYQGTMSGGTYKKFGDWPQTIKAADVTVGSGTLVRGGLSYHVGSDGNYYVKAEEKAYGTGDAYKYSDRNQAGQDGTSTQWFKVEPIVWRVLTENYLVPGENGQPVESGNSLLLAEKILTGGIPYYVNTIRRTIDSATVYANNYKYSIIRAWLNGLDVVESDSENDSTYKDKGFLQTAFTTSAQNLIEETTVDNSKESTFGRGETGGDNPYVCTNTSDKIFLLSEQEATTAGYGFVAYNEYGEGKTRIRVTTDYAKATGAYQDSTAGCGGWWWLRSPFYRDEDCARYINDFGSAVDHDDFVINIEMGVVPALSISMNGN